MLFAPRMLCAAYQHDSAFWATRIPHGDSEYRLDVSEAALAVDPGADPSTHDDHSRW